MLIFAENSRETPEKLDELSNYCNLWHLKINTAKTKIGVFFKI